MYIYVIWWFHEYTCITGNADVLCIRLHPEVQRTFLVKVALSSKEWNEVYTKYFTEINVNIPVYV